MSCKRPRRGSASEEEDELENIVLAADERKRISEARLKKATKYSPRP